MMEAWQEREDLPKYLPLNIVTEKQVEDSPVYQLTTKDGYVLNVRVEDAPTY